MSGLARILAALAALIAFSAPARANDAWMLIQSVGEVSVTAPGATPVAAKPSSPLPNGSTIKTGTNGRAVLLRGRETIVMSPMSSVTLPSGPNREISKLQQGSGTLLFKIGKKPEAHFEVNTPYLAAVVKGTTFTVSVSSKGASVHVLEGAVEVATPDRLQSYLTRAGQISTVFAKAANDIFTTGASALGGGGANAELWGTDVSDFEFGGASPWSSSGETLSFGDTGLKSLHRAPKKDVALTERAPQRMVAAAKAVEETMGASAARNKTNTPKSSTIKVAHTETPTDEKDKSLKASAADEKARKTEAVDEKARKAEKPSTATRKPEAKQTDRSERPAAPKPANVWTVTQAKGEIEIDGYPFTNFGDGLVRTLPPGTKVETGPNGRLGVAHGLAEFVIDANTVAVLGDANEVAKPQVVSGQALSYAEKSGRYEAVANLTPSEIEALRASGALDDAPSQDAAAAAISVGGGSGNSAVSTSVDIPTPRMTGMTSGGKTKTEEVRTKVISGLTLGLYGLTALLVLAFGAQWAWRRYRSKSKKAPVESAAEVRLRNIKAG
jgi:hypothetical protein